MPFDPSNLPADTQLMIAVRDRLTPQTWSPFPSDNHGCLVQWLHREAGTDQDAYRLAHLRLVRSLPFGSNAVTSYNDSHSLSDVVDLLDRAIAGEVSTR